MVWMSSDTRTRNDCRLFRRNNLGDFVPLLEEFVRSDRSLSTASRAALLTRYKRNVRSGSDPFKRAVFCVLGGCEPNENHPEVASSIDDFLWIKLSQLSWPCDDEGPLNR